jgi:phosphoenolpyruvate synthase/pyruvate phosphate dikinase
MSVLVLPLAACTPELSDSVGGKAVGLGALLSQNLPVPDGFAVTTAAYSATITTVRDAIGAVIAAGGAHNDAQTSATLRTLIETVGIPADVAAAMSDAYLQLVHPVSPLSRCGPARQPKTSPTQAVYQANSLTIVDRLG